MAQAKAAILMDASSGRILYQKNAHELLPPASLTKIMTALLVVENGDLDQQTTISQHAADTEERSIWLEAGEKLTRRQLLYACMLNSANDAAAALSESVGGSEKNFAKRMNQRAQQLGMKDSHFCNPHGLPISGHYTSAYDLAILSRKAIGYKIFRQVVSTKTQHIPWTGNDYDRLLINQNRLLYRYDGAIGIKTGYTKEAGSCVVGAAQKGSLVLIAVALNSPKVYEDLQQMLDYGFANYKLKTIKMANQLVVEVPVENGTSDEIQVRPETNLAVAVKAAERSKITYKFYPHKRIEAPIRKNQVLGSYEIFIAGHDAGQVNILASAAVAKKPPFLTRFKAACIKIIKFIFVTILIIFCLAYSIRRINIWRNRKMRTIKRRPLRKSSVDNYKFKTWK
ncbi:MAG: D-alanyl-D-alanine carboxypeptidase family protein [Ignavibacteriales bacterium]